jgi:hypothetical protein
MSDQSYYVIHVTLHIKTICNLVPLEHKYMKEWGTFKMRKRIAAFTPSFTVVMWFLRFFFLYGTMDQCSLRPPSFLVSGFRNLCIGIFVGLLVQGISPSQDFYLHRTTLLQKICKHPCWDSSSWSQCVNSTRQYTLWPHMTTMIIWCFSHHYYPTCVLEEA